MGIAVSYNGLGDEYEGLSRSDPEQAEKLGWSQYKLAKEVGIAQSFMNEIEKGRKSPSLEVFFRICEALDIQLFPNEEGE